MEKDDVSVISGKSKQKGGNLRRNSTGKTISRASLSPSESEEKPLPHYLRASTSSCHDFCKYGRKHAFESKGISPVSSMFAKRQVTPIQGQKQIKNLDSKERNNYKKPVINLKISPEQKIEFPAKPKVIKLKSLSSSKKIDVFAKPVIIKLKSLSSSKKINVSTKPTIIKLKSLSSSKKIDASAKPTFIKLKSLSSSKKIDASAKPTFIKLKSLSSSKKIDASAKPTFIKLKSLSSSKKIDVSAKPAFIKLKSLSSSKKIDVSAKPAFIKLKSLSSSKKIDVSAKPTINKLKSFSPAKKTDGSVDPKKVSKQKPTTEKSPSSNPSGIIGGRTSDNKKVKSTGLSKIGEKRGFKPGTASLTSNLSANGVSGLRKGKFDGIRASPPKKNQNNVRNITSVGKKIRERPLSEIETNPEDKVIEVIKHEIRKDRSSFISSSPLSLSASSTSSSPYSFSQEEMHEEPGSSGNEENNSDSPKNGKQLSHPKGEEKLRLRRGTAIYPEDKDCTPWKLKFQRGRVINPQSESNGPRKLRFRQGKTMSENSKIETGRRSFRKKRELGFSDSNNTSSGPQSVVLRHQDVQGKKDTQDLNHVIEETANKLVETRKSKVKALVGAFETVISLQESKPVAGG